MKKPGMRKAVDALKSNVVFFPAQHTAESTREASMDEAKKAEVIALFAEMKAAAAIRRRKLLRKKQSEQSRGTQIVNSTIIVCGDNMPSWLGDLIAQNQRTSGNGGGA